MNNLAAPIQWHAEAIWEAIAPVLPGFTVEVLPEIDSTNTELMRRAKAGQGRDWHNLSAREPASLPALTFSLGLPLSPVDWSGLSLAVGVSVAQSLHPAIGLKWPNDLWLKERKLAGILIETAVFHGQRYAVIGVGINLSEPPSMPDAASPILRTPPAWLQELLPAISAPEVLERVALPLVQTILAFADDGFAPFQARFNALDVLRDRNVTLHNGQTNHSDTARTTGSAHGVSDSGALLVLTGSGMQLVSSAEVSVRPF
jgi:BirA family transcriptional regulator, biotin operon repressor / biotin---[acetyl-CoA-carboxylase] ligase